MGVLIPGPDMTAVRRTAAFFLKNFEDRLAQQQKEAKANPDYDANFKGARSKEEKKAVRKQILSNIGALIHINLRPCCNSHSHIVRERILGTPHGCLQCHSCHVQS